MKQLKQVQSILEWHKNETIDDSSSDYHVLKEFVANHHRYQEGTEQISHFKSVPLFKGNQLQVVDKDGQVDIVSIYKCVGTRTNRLKKAMREAVRPFLLPKTDIVCGMCSRETPKDDVHVDHVYEFDHIVHDFFKQTTHPKPVSFHGDLGYLYFYEKDHPFRDDFIAFHNSFKDNLRLVCSNCNLTRKRYKYDG